MSNILDVGCAIGTITNAVAQLNKNGNTHGLDISEDAIEVAKKKYPKCTFYCQSAEQLDNFPDECFDIIHAKEFYPFTRTNDKNYHLKYLKLFGKKLKQRGFIVLQMVALDKGFCNTYKKLQKELIDIGFSIIRKETMIPVKYFKLFGNLGYNKLFYPILLLTARTIFWIINRGQFGYLYILTKK